MQHDRIVDGEALSRFSELNMARKCPALPDNEHFRRSRLRRTKTGKFAAFEKSVPHAGQIITQRDVDAIETAALTSNILSEPPPIDGPSQVIIPSIEGFPPADAHCHPMTVRTRENVRHWRTRLPFHTGDVASIKMPTSVDTTHLAETARYEMSTMLDTPSGSERR